MSRLVLWGLLWCEQGRFVKLLKGIEGQTLHWCFLIVTLRTHLDRCLLCTCFRTTSRYPKVVLPRVQREGSTFTQGIWCKPLSPPVDTGSPFWEVPVPWSVTEVPSELNRTTPDRQPSDSPSPTNPSVMSMHCDTLSQSSFLETFEDRGSVEVR